MNTTTATVYDFFEEWNLPLGDIDGGRAIQLRILMMTWIIICLLLGVPGNILVIASIIFMKHLRQIPHIFVANLAMFDLGVMSMNSFALIGVFCGDTFLPSYPILCEMSGVICMLSCFGSLWTMMFVAINRYVFICKNEWYEKLFNLKMTILIMVLIWVCVTLLDLPNFKFIGWGGHAFSPLILHCSFRLDNVWWFNTILYTGLALCVPMWVILFCYVQIWRAATTSSSASGSTSKRRKKEQRQLMISLITIFVAFVLTWIPFGTLVFLFGYDLSYVTTTPFEVYLLADLWAHTNSSVNFIIYGFTHRGFRKAYKTWMVMIVPCYHWGKETTSGVNPSSQSAGVNKARNPIAETKN
ncbi:melatonin receptor type 1C-like [Convolutriloba macropyga]|uniref:melatonin receptor type 1C-like n=1 Tax=Convolutriloba macropyga TaxID=536237 RepID=UPI003F51C1B7